ncbi:MAG: GNAT family N-acetyltransferase [Oscillospiraceae bacterium]|nr:GNAT family N-acetyltransferase [Oscillospiraceae bacterium]
MLIKKDNLTIREAQASDAPQLGIWWRDGAVMAHAGYPNGLAITDEEIAEDLLMDTDETRRRLIAEADGQQIGEMSYRNKGFGKAEIGIKICEVAKQERGYGSRLLKMLIEELFENHGYEKIVLDTNLENRRAQHVYEKLGFRKIGVRHDCFTDQLGKLQSAVDYEMTRERCDYGKRNRQKRHT